MAHMRMLGVGRPLYRHTACMLDSSLAQMAIEVRHELSDAADWMLATLPSRCTPPTLFSPLCVRRRPLRRSSCVLRLRI